MHSHNQDKNQISMLTMQAPDMHAKKLKYRKIMTADLK